VGPNPARKVSEIALGGQDLGVQPMAFVDRAIEKVDDRA
jgi:hypothetical protein